MSAGLRTSQVATAAGVNTQTLRYYERRGLLDQPSRSPGGHRLYPPETVTTLRMIKAAQRLGFTLAEVADMVEAAHPRSHRMSQALHERARIKLADVQARIADLQVIASALEAAVDAGCDNLVACASDPGCPLPFPELADRDDEPAESPASP